MVQTLTTRGAERRLEILRAAAEVFRRKGFAAAGMREIAEALSLAPGALYYYFESKEDLLHACQEESLRLLLGRGEHPSAKRPGAKHGEIRCRYALRWNQLGISCSSAGKRQRTGRVARDVLKHILLLREHRVARKRPALASRWFSRRIALEEQHRQATSVRKWRLAPERGVYHAERDGQRSDSEREGQRDGDRERAGMAERAKCVFQEHGTRRWVLVGCQPAPGCCMEMR